MRKTLLKFFSAVGISCPSQSLGDARKTREISYNGGVLCFSIPPNWCAKSEPNGGGLYYRKGSNAGTLRLNIITAESPKEVTHDTASALLAGFTKGKVEVLVNGNSLSTQVQHTQERGRDITIHTWYLSAAVPPTHIRIAIFTYTLPACISPSKTDLDDISFLDTSVRQARFSSELGHIVGS